MPHSFPTTGNAAQIVGRTPWSARVPLDPLLDTVKSARCDPREADEGVGCGPGGPPHNLTQNVRSWENYVALGSELASSTKTATVPSNSEAAGEHRRKFKPAFRAGLHPQPDPAGQYAPWLPDCP